MKIAIKLLVLFIVFNIGRGVEVYRMRDLYEEPAPDTTLCPSCMYRAKNPDFESWCRAFEDTHTRVRVNRVLKEINKK